MKLHFYDQYGNRLENLTQWDSNAIIQITSYPHTVAPVFHFTNHSEDESLTVRSTISQGTVSVVVPNVLLTRSRPIDVFVFQYDSASDEGRTIYHERIPVISKRKPNDYEYIDNTKIIEVSTLQMQLEALIAAAEETVNIRIDDLTNSYDAALQGIKDGISEDVLNLNTSIADNRDKLELDITNSRTKLESDVASALSTMIDSVDDGSPRGVFADTSDLSDMPAGVYLYTNSESEDDGYIFYWDGTHLSERLLYYAGIVVNNGTITYEKLSSSLQKEAVSKVIQCTLAASDWSDMLQPVDVSASYVVTAHTKANIDADSSLYTTLQEDGCLGIYITTENDNGASLVAHAIGNSPIHDITIQITIKETK